MQGASCERTKLVSNLKANHNKDEMKQMVLDVVKELS
ncbi:hypothetical protein BH09BAC2_BH09BAC2_23140 [soil metagenome]